MRLRDVICSNQLYIGITTFLLDVTKVVSRKKVFVSDFVKVAMLFYISIIYTEMMSPASDYFAMLFLFYVIVTWVELEEKKEKNIAPYGMLCVLLFPYLAQNIILSGWLVYPLEKGKKFSLYKKWRKIAIYFDGMIRFEAFFYDKIKGVKRCKGEMSMCQAEKETKDEKYCVTKVMLELGMPAHLRGYHYLREGICMSIENMELVGSITKLLYPEIAKRFHTTDIKVERAIRSVIEVGWERGNEGLFEEIFGYSRIYGKSRPTNSEFILGVADQVSRKLLEKET